MGLGAIIVLFPIISKGVEPSADASVQADEKTHSLAREILALEGERGVNSVVLPALERLIAGAVRNFVDTSMEPSEEAKAQHFFEAVDRALIEGDVIFPPGGEIDLFRDGLKPHALTEAEYARAETRFANFRRLPWMRANQTARGTFLFFDCDLASLVYVAAAERLGLPVFAVEVPGHTFVRWQSEAVTLNWDPNDGIVYPDDYYIRTWHVPAANGPWPRYFENLSHARVLSTWAVLCGRHKNAAGDFDGALTDFRRALESDPTDLDAVNGLAWLLATCPSANVRNGAAALELAKANIARARRAVWLQTLAAAQAESGDFAEAIAAEEESQHTSDSLLGWVSPRETVIDHERCLAAYRSGRPLRGVHQ